MRRTIAMLVAVSTVGVGVVAPAAIAGRENPVTVRPAGYGLTDAGSLVRFNASDTSRARRIGTVTGLAAGEKLLGIDIRPVAGDIYGLSDRANLYIIDRQSARATRKSSLITSSGTPVTLEGRSFGIDFNPTSDRLRVTSDARQNLRIDVDSGVTSVDQALAYRTGDRNAGARPRAVGVAYTNNDNDSFIRPDLHPAGRRATGTMLYTIDAARGSLALQAPPNDGTLRTVGRLRQRTGSVVGFDIFSPVNGQGNTVANIGFASLRRHGRTRLYKVNLRTGRAKPVKGGGRQFRSVKDIAIVP